MPSRYLLNRLPFGPEYYAQNLGRVRRSLHETGCDAALIFDPENIFWLTGFKTVGYFTFQCAVVATDGSISLVSRQVNHAIAFANKNISAFIGVGDSDDSIEILATFLNGRFRDGTVGVETTSGYCSINDYKNLVLQTELKLVDWHGPMANARMIKTSKQRDYMQEAANAAVAGISSAIEEVAIGKTENHLAAAMLGASIRAGSEFTRVPLVVAGEASGTCFNTWERRVLKAGDLIFLESAANVHRYHAMISRNCVVGKATQEQRRFSSLVFEALNRAIESIRPGVTSHHVDSICRAVFEREGLDAYFDHRTAYSIGIGFPPNWAEGRFLSLRPHDNTILEAGMAFHLVPSLFLPGAGFMASESVFVSDSGCEVLTNFPQKLFELD